jgi:hypothetical protein
MKSPDIRRRGVFLDLAGRERGFQTLGRGCIDKYSIFLQLFAF